MDHSFKTGIEWNRHGLKFDRHTAGIILTRQKLQVFPSRTGTRQVPLLLNMALGVLGIEARQEEEIKDI